MDRVALVVSPHGFGHAARASAVADALRRVRPDVGLELFTTVPEWFFADSIEGPVGYHEMQTDVGLVQRGSLTEDPVATADALAPFVPFDERCVPLAEQLTDLGCRLVLCDIAPLGIAAARHAGVHSVLVENFTWDWIYRSYADEEPRLGAIGEEMANLVASVTLHVQAEPVCQPAADAVTVPPVYRRRRTPDHEVRRVLGVGDDRPLVLMTMGGAAFSFDYLDRLRQQSDIVFIVHGSEAPIDGGSNLIALPRHSPVFMPDLVGAVDAVVGKLGYSTVAEAWAAGTRYAYVPRDRFAESAVLAEFVDGRLPVLEIDRDEFAAFDWLDGLHDLVSTPRPAPATANGAETIAHLLVDLL